MEEGECMKEIVARIAKLIDVKSITTFTFVFLVAILALRRDVAGNEVTDICKIILGFYFGTQSEKRKEVVANENKSTDLSNTAENN